MAAPEYDFFATGPRPKPTGPANDRFGVPSVPSTPQPPMPQRFAPEGSGTVVNQFGLPVDEARPTGPLAAPGYGAVPVHNSIAAGYDDVPSVWDPTTAAARPRSRALPPSAIDAPPGQARAAGIIAIVLGSLTLLAGGLALLAYLSAKGEIDRAIAAAGARGAEVGSLASAVLASLLVLVLLLLAGAVIAIVAGVLTMRGRRWAGWTLLGLSALAFLGYLKQAFDGTSTATGSAYDVGHSFGTWIALGSTLAIVLLLTVGDGGRWLRRS